MKIKAALIVFVFIGIVAYAALSADREFVPAEDLPREALVFVEFTDLPAFLQLWEKSELKQKYLESENFNSLKQRRLGLKLASRWQEFNEAVGFPLDLDIVGSLAEKRAAIGIYDIGKLEFVFIAPVSSEIFTATAFFQNKEQFEEKLLENGTSVFSTNVAADRGRQPHKLLFASIKGRFILATSESLLLQTLNNINGIAGKNRLADEPSFKSLTENLEPNLVSVWVNQTALNKDYYFKRYWLMPDANKLKNIRAGIFEITLEEKKIVERRKFLLENAANTPKLNPDDTQNMISLVPADISFYQVRTADAKTSADAIFDCILDRKTQTAKTESRNYFPGYSFYDFDESEHRDYEYLDRKFDETIDENPEDDFKESKVFQVKSHQSELQNVLRAASPQSVLTLTEPQNLPVPLFAEFHRAAVIKTTGAVNQTQFETAIAKVVKNRISIITPDINLIWKNAGGENRFSWRELNLPMLGWEISYAQRGKHLIVSNDSNLLREILARSEDMQIEEVSAAAIDNLTVIHLKNKNENFDEIFGTLTAENANDFFLENVGSLIETLSGIKTIVIENSNKSGYREEKITFDFE